MHFKIKIWSSENKFTNPLNRTYFRSFDEKHKKLTR